MRYYVPISMAALNRNINDNLIFSGAYTGLRRIDNTNAIQMSGGREGVAGDGARLFLFGKAGGVPGQFTVTVPNTAGDADVTVLRIDPSDDPRMQMESHRITNLAAPTTALDALNYNAMTSWNPTLVWGVADPAAITKEAYYNRIGKTVFFNIWISSADSNATNSLTITLPSTPANLGAAHNVSISAWQAYGVAGTTYGNPLAYLLQSGAENRIRFLDFKTATDGQFVAVSLQGFYQEA